jgi:hypothetical protein
MPASSGASTGKVRTLRCPSTLPLLSLEVKTTNALLDAQGSLS